MPETPHPRDTAENDAPEHVCDSGDFDRTLCGCGAMHSYCGTCGLRADPCSLDEEPPRFTPIRVCCGQRHHGPVCPDGLVMCQLCFKRVTRGRLHVLEEGDGLDASSAPIYEDVCVTCKRREDAWGTRVIPPDEGFTVQRMSDGHLSIIVEDTRVIPPAVAEGA